MRAKQLTLCSVFTIFVIACYHFPALADGNTAKAGLAQAQANAKKWKADATLVQLLTLTGNADGTADKWTYVFHSPEAKQGYNVYVSNGKVVQELEVSASFTDSVSSDFVDSAEVIVEAKKKGLKMKGKVMMMLHIMLQGTKNEGAYWNILGDMTEENSMIFDAETGKFYKLQKFQ